MQHCTPFALVYLCRRDACLIFVDVNVLPLGCFPLPRHLPSPRPWKSNQMKRNSRILPKVFLALCRQGVFLGYVFRYSRRVLSHLLLPHLSPGQEIGYNETGQAMLTQVFRSAGVSTRRVLTLCYRFFTVSFAVSSPISRSPTSRPAPK